MKKLFVFLTILAPVLLGSCENSDDGGGPMPTGESKTYQLTSKSDSSISGTATLAENNDGSTTLTLDLSGTSSGNMHPAHIHANSAAEGGAIMIDLMPIDGATGMSVTQIKAFNDGTKVTYTELLSYDGYINVHQSATDLGTLIAQGDIGANELTGQSKAYDLGPVSQPDISGTATFSERKNGTTLITVNLMGTSDGDKFPAHIHANTAAESGPIVINLDTIVGPSGMSLTQIDAMNDGTPITYDELLDFDGYINAHVSKDNLGVLVAQGDIGQNELTGNTKQYALAPKVDGTISGTVTFSERANMETLAVIMLQNAANGTDHPAHIHSGSVATAPGAIIVTFKSVSGATGMSKTNITQLDDGTPIDYAGITTIDGYVNVHVSAIDLATLIAQGNVGANAD